MEKDILVKVTAHNCPGLLQRVCALFSRRFFNIQSIVAAQNLNPGFSDLYRRAGRQPDRAAGRKAAGQAV